jgi:starch phosphorylase
MANPSLAAVITEAIGEDWIGDFSQIARLKTLANDSQFRSAFRDAKRRAKLRFVDWMRSTSGQVADPDSIFDSQIKRIHEYKRQLLNALHIVILYNRIRRNPALEVPPRTFFFAGKAAPAYHLAKLIIKFINNLAAAVDSDPSTQGKLKVIFLPDYSVSVAERLIPASDVSEQISTAGYEASGTSNMKFMLNGALTIGTRDGATVEMAEEVGEANMFLFGLTARQVEETRSWYNPHWHYDNDPETRAALDLIASGHFNPSEPRVFDPILDLLLAKGDFYLHLADLRSYSDAHERLGNFYLDPAAWDRAAVLNVASSGKFSSDRTIAQYAAQIWNVTACPTVEDLRAAESVA